MTMNAQELLIYLTEKQIGRLFDIARKFPSDKLDWKATPCNRTALDMLQEIATALQVFMPGILSRKVEFSPEVFGKWAEDRSKITNLDELERLAKEGMAELKQAIISTPEGEWSIKVDMPFPGEFNVADLLSYQYWNASYHEGQIMFLEMMASSQAGF